MNRNELQLLLGFTQPTGFNVLKQAFTKNYDIDFANELTQGLLNKKEHTTTARLINKQIDKNLKTYFAKIK